MRLLGLALFSLLLASAPPASADPRPRAVLMLDEADPSDGVPTMFSTTVRAALNDRQPHIAVYGETLDLSRFAGPKQELVLHTYLQQKYSDVRFGAVLAVGSSAFQLASRWRSDLWPGVPLIFAAIDEVTAAQIMPEKETTGLVMRRTIKSMLAAARDVVPNLKEIVVLGGSLERDAYRRRYIQELTELEAGVTVLNLTGRPLAEQLDQARRLPEGSAILYTSLFIDDAGTRYSSPDALVEIAKRANRPIVVDVGSLVGLGAIGGYVLDNIGYGKEVAALAIRVLEGADVNAIPITASEFTRPIFDWRQMVRWNVVEAALPKGSEIRFQPPSAWSQYRAEIALVAAALLIQAALIVYVLVENRRRRRAETSFAESEGRMKFTAASANVGLWQFRPDTDDMWMTEHSFSMFGLPVGTSASRVAILAAIHPGDRAMAKDLLFARNGAHWTPTNDVRVVLPNDEVRWIRIRARSEQLQDDAANRISGIFMDVTGQKAAEAEAAEQRNEVAHLMRVATLGELSGAISHELSQPLTAIQLNSEAALFLLGQASPDVGEACNALRDVISDGYRASKIVRGARSMLKKDENRHEPVNLNNVVTSTMTLLRSELVFRNVKVDISLADDLPTTAGNMVQLQQVLLNLLVNAMDAMASTPEHRRTVSLSTHGVEGGVRVVVRDHGSGIRPADRSRLFEPFFTTKDRGLGLGLTICSAIIRAHGGELTLANHEDGGAVAAFSLPGQTASSPASDAPP